MKVNGNPLSLAQKRVHQEFVPCLQVGRGDRIAHARQSCLDKASRRNRGETETAVHAAAQSSVPTTSGSEASLKRVVSKGTEESVPMLTKSELNIGARSVRCSCSTEIPTKNARETDVLDRACCSSGTRRHTWILAYGVRIIIGSCARGDTLGFNCTGGILRVIEISGRLDVHASGGFRCGRAGPSHLPLLKLSFFRGPCDTNTVQCQTFMNVMGLMVGRSLT